MLGGKRIKIKFTTGQQALLDFLWKKKGGISEVARTLDCHVQKPVNWRLRGHVPLRLCNKVAEKLKVPVWGLNYRDLVKFATSSSDIPSWTSVVKSYGLNSNEVKSILALEEPQV